MILNLPSLKIKLSANIFYQLLYEVMKNMRMPGDNYKSDTQTLTRTHLFYDLNVLTNANAGSMGKFDNLYHDGRLQGTYKNAASQFNSENFTAARSSIFILNDTDVVAAFDDQVKTDYAAAYKKAVEFAHRYFDCTASAGNNALVQKILYLINSDDSISDTQSFYICPDGSAKTKADFANMADLEFEAFLLGVWHYLVTSQRLQEDLKNCKKITIDSGYQQLNVKLTYSEITTDETSKKPVAIDFARVIHVEKNREQEEMRETMDTSNDGYPLEFDRDTDIISILENGDITLSISVFFYLLTENIQTIHPKRDRNADRRLFLDLLKLTVGQDFEMKSDQGLSRYCHDNFRQFQMHSSAQCLDDSEKIKTFSERLRTNYEDVLCDMIEIRKKYFCSGERMKRLWSSSSNSSGMTAV